MISRPNLLEVEDMVKGFPDQMLFQQAQNPSGEIPQFLLVSEIQRRSDMRKDYEAQQQQPENTVAEQIMQQGIAASVPNQPQMPSMSQQNMAPMPPQMPPQGMPPQQQPMMPMPPQMPPQQPQMPNMGMAQGGVVRMQNLGQAPNMMTGRQFAYHEMGLPISGLSEMTPDEIRGLIDNLIVSGQQEKAMGLINDLRMYAFNPAMAGDPGEMDAYKDIVTQYDVGDYASTTDVDPMRMSVQDALQQYGDAPSAVEGLIDEGGIANLDVAGNIPLSVQAEMAADPQNIGFDTPISKARSYLPSRFPLATPTGDPILLTTPTDEEKRQNLIENYATIPNVTQSDVLREKLAIARAGQNVSDAADVGAKGIEALYDAKVQPVLDVAEELGGKFSEKYLRDPLYAQRQAYINELGEKYGRDLTGRWGGQLLRSGTSTLLDVLGDVGTDAYDATKSGIVGLAKSAKEAVEPFATQALTGSDDPTDISVPNIKNLIMPGYKSNTALTQATDQVTPDIDTSALTTEQLNTLIKKEGQANLQAYKAAQGDGKGAYGGSAIKPSKYNPASSKSTTGNSKIQAQARNDKLDQIESNIAQRNAIDELRGLVGAENYGKVPDMTDLIDEYKDDALSNALINLGAGIAGGDLSGGLTRAGASALESRRAARDLRKQQIVAEQALQQEGKSRDIDILSAIAKIEAEKDISGAVTRRKNLQVLETMYEEQMRLRAATFDEDEKKRIDEIITRIQSAMAGYGLTIPDPKTKKFGELNTGI